VVPEVAVVVVNLVRTVAEVVVEPAELVPMLEQT
jgi:hypothetical protein